VSFADLNKLSEAQIADIKRKGTVVIKDVVDDDQARAWKTSLEEFVEANPHAEGLITFALSTVLYLVTPQGFPEADKQFFHV
jgi:adenosylmethionine-8-amino-7-oxononanoate aminotransferase